MGFSRPEGQIARIKDSLIITDDLTRACINKTAVELVHVKSSAPLSSAIDFAATDTMLEKLTLLNDDFEEAELHPNYGRLEHTIVSDLIIGSHVLCDIIDHSIVTRLKVFGDAVIKYESKIHTLDVTTVGRVIIFGCDVEYMDVYGTVIMTHCKIGTLNLHAGGRLFHHSSKVDHAANRERQIVVGKIKLDDPYVLNLLTMNEFNFMYG